MVFLHRTRKIPELNVTAENEMFKMVPGKEQGYAAILIDKRANEPLMCYKFYEQEVKKNGKAMKSVKEKGPDTKTVLILDRIDTTKYFKKLTTEAGEAYKAAMREGMTPDKNGRYHTIDTTEILKTYMKAIGYDEMSEVVGRWTEEVPYDDIYTFATSKKANSVIDPKGEDRRTIDGKSVNAMKEDGVALGDNEKFETEINKAEDPAEKDGEER